MINMIQNAKDQAAALAMNAYKAAVADGTLPEADAPQFNVEIPNDIDEFTTNIWENLNEANKISIYVRYVDLTTGVRSGKNRTVIGRYLRCRHKGIGNGQHDRHQKKYRKTCCYQGSQRDLDALHQFLFMYSKAFPSSVHYPSTSFPK